MIWRSPERSDELYHWGKKKKHKYVVKIGSGDDVRYFYSYEEYNNYKDGQKMTLVTDPKEIKEHEKEAQARFEANQIDKKQNIINQKRVDLQEHMKKQLTDDAILRKDPGRSIGKKPGFDEPTDKELWPLNRKKTTGEKIRDFLKDQLREYGVNQRNKQQTQRSFAKEMGKEISYQAKEAGKKWVEKETKKKSLLSEAADFLKDLDSGKIKFDSSNPASSKPKRVDKPKKSTKGRSKYN